MNRIDFIDKINKYASRFVLEVEGFNSINQYHINIHAENFLIPVLNEVFDLDLENLNISQKKNFPSIDLADFNNRVAFQITATNDQKKIKDSLEKFFKFNLDKYFDLIYFYIITHKKEKYNQNQLNTVINPGFTFSITDHVIDKENILQKINAISSSSKLQTIAKLFELEFSDVQIELRKNKFEKGYLNTEPEDLSSNLLRINFPHVLYKAELNIDEQAIIDSTNDFLISIGKRPIKKMRKGKVVKKALKKYNSKVQDWLLHENWIYSFTNLSDNSETLSHIIDHGTVTSIECKDFYERSEENKKVFKHLLRNTLMELCRLKSIEWFGKKEIFRFASDRKKPQPKQVKWKGEKEATKTVIFKILNKTDDHLICFRHLAFRSSFINIEEDWYLVINPTWSFTNPGGYYQSRFEPSYMAGIKRLENNNSIYNYFRFFRYYLAYNDLFTSRYDNIKVTSIDNLTLTPSLVDSAWKPVKLPEKQIIEPQVDLTPDDELSDNTLFD